jgi:AcrR family transcriptional regulator
MSRIAGSNGTKTAEAIQAAALDLVYLHGFEGFGLRALAARVGLQPASLYNHFPTKQTLLFGLIGNHMDALIRRTRAALETCGSRPRDRLRAFIAHHLDYHIEKKQLVYVANFELRALTPENLAHVIGQRKTYEALLIGILDDGCACGDLDIPDTHVTAYAILAMLTGACTWYKSDGRLGKAKMIALHTQLALEGCTHREPAAPAGRAAKAALSRARRRVTKEIAQPQGM